MFTLNWIRASAVCVTLGLFHLTCTAAELELPPADRASAWFAPTLVTSNRSICAAALEAERATFFTSYESQPDIPGLMAVQENDGTPSGDPDVAVLENSPLQLALTLPDRRRAIIRILGYPGCGGACETGSVAIADELLPGTDRYGPGRWRLFKAADGDFYLRGTVDDHTQWYRVAAPDRFELACDIALKPDTSKGNGAVYSQTVWDAIESLRVATGRMAGGAGNCGSIGIERIRAQYSKDGLEAALYRPWAVAPGHHDYARIVDHLELWSLGGVMEHRDFIAYQTELARAVAVVTQFYRAMYGWAPDRAEEMAGAALKGAINRAFGFSAYDNDSYRALGERDLRQAILARAPLEQIRGIEFDAGQIDREGQDSILNVAIEYPEALSYLLQKGFNPNIANAFGKTPVMYAAQYNQVAAAELLLEAGADPNATTHLPDDQCAFTIRTSSLTPLHYATRYSSARLIRLLLGHGAVTFIQSTGETGAEYPLDRLHRYTGASDERNPHISESDVPGLEQSLAVPSVAKKVRLAKDLVTRARSEYARGNAQQAYQQLRLTLLTQPDQPGPIADLPLIALRAGYIGPAISAADRAISTMTSSASLAAAWFNKGLICEHPQARHVTTVDEARCYQDTLDPFVKSWKLQPSAARANKLRGLIREPAAASCVAAEPYRYYRIALAQREAFRVYVLHRADEEIDVSQIRWQSTGPVEPKVAGALVTDQLKLGEDAVTVLEVPLRNMRGSGPHTPRFWIEGRDCSPQL